MRRYAPFYCEENVYWLAQELALAARRREVVFVLGEGRGFVMYEQRAGRGRPIVWDYHVVLLAGGERGAEIWDLDCTRGAPLPLASWLDVSFPRSVPGLAPQFRLVPADVFVSSFSSDRAHMRRRDGTYRAPPPPWPCILAGPPNLARYLDVRDVALGEIADLAALRSRA